MFDSLNDEQRAAVTHGEGPLLVVAGAGTGKTRTLVCRVARLIEAGVPPERLLLLTFTRRAAREMLGRAALLTDQRAAGRVWGGTFHAVANRLLRLGGRPLGIRPDFTVLDASDGSDLLGLIRDDLGLATGRRRFPKKETLAAIYSRAVNAGVPLPRVLARWFPWCAGDVDGIRSAFDVYTARKRERNVLDFDDLLLYWNALAADPEAGDAIGARFEHVLVDEYQDTNSLQADILANLRRRLPNITVVGDDAQAIYSFRAATVRNILEFPARFPGTTVIRLERNYRSTQPVLDASNAVIALSPQRHEKSLWTAQQEGERPVLLTCRDESEQSDEVCRAILEHRERGTMLRRQAVLFRAAHHSDLLEIELARRNIPFVKYGGLRFLEAAHVKDALALLRILENPLDEVGWFRVLQLLEGVGPATARRVMTSIGLVGPGPENQGEGLGGAIPAAGGAAAITPLARFLDEQVPFPPAAGPDVERLRSAFRDCGADVPPAAQLERLRGFLEPIFARRYAAVPSRLRDLEQLERVAARSGSRARFLADLALDPPASTSDLAGPPLLDDDYVILSTMHSAKGLEWDVVHVIHAADGMIPSDLATGDEDEVEEERRLLYVAMTRARRTLRVYFPLRYYRRPRGLEDPHAYAQLTRFLPPDVLATFEERSTEGAVSAEDPAELHPGGDGVAAARVDSYLAGLFADPGTGSVTTAS